MDNASADGTADAVRSALPTVEVIENAENLGFARGNDVAIPLLEGRASCFLNSDAVPAPGSFEAAVAYLDAHPTVGAVGPRLQNADGSAQRSTTSTSLNWSRRYISRVSPPRSRSRSSRRSRSARRSRLRSLAAGAGGLRLNRATG